MGSGNVFFILSDNDEFIGCVAVDTLNFYPCISNLIVQSEKRDKGFGSVLLEAGEEYAKRFKHGIVRLWCETSMFPFYVKRKYTKGEQIKEDVFLMQKRL